MTVAATASARIAFRTLTPTEPLPTHLDDSLLLFPAVYRDWVWVAESDGLVIGLIVAIPCHGVVMILRAHMADGAPRTALLALLRRFFADVRARGYGYFMSWFGEADAERVLARIAERLGGVIHRQMAVAIASPLPPEGT